MAETQMIAKDQILPVYNIFKRKQEELKAELVQLEDTVNKEIASIVKSVFKPEEIENNNQLAEFIEQKTEETYSSRRERLEKQLRDVENSIKGLNFQKYPPEENQESSDLTN